VFGWIAVGLVVAVIVAVGALAIVGMGMDQESGESGSGSPQQSATQLSTAPSAAVPDPFATSRRAFPNLVPQGRDTVGEAYQGASCSAARRGAELRLQDEPLLSSPWVSAWECDRRDRTTTQMNYTILEFASAADARAAVDSLPVNQASTGSKGGVPLSAHRWIVSDPPGPSQPYYHTAKLVVSFETDPAHSNFLLYVSNRGPFGIIPQATPPSAQDALTAWWDGAPL
jgi:hypothetical protein